MLFVGRGAGGNGTDRRYAARKRCVNEKKKEEEKNKHHLKPFKVVDSVRVARIHPSVRLVCKHFAPSKVFFLWFVCLGCMKRKKILQVPPGLEKKCGMRTNRNTTTEAPQQKRRQSTLFCVNSFAHHEPCDRLQTSSSSYQSRRNTHSGKCW